MVLADSLLTISPMKLTLSSAILSAGLILSSAAHAQKPGQSAPPPSQEKQDSDTPKVSVTGCLTKGSGTNYQIADQKSGEKLAFPGPAQLDKYVNQTVTLTGTMMSQGAGKVFHPEAINQVAASCEKSQ
jgi:hypothetical protein